MQLVQLDMKQISSEAEIYDCLVGQMNFTNADEKPEWMNVIEMNERDPYEMDTEEQPEDPEFKKILETPEKTLDGLVQMLAARLADDYCLEVIRDEAADDEKKELEKRLDEAHITCNKNTVPNDPRSPFVTSGVRLGTPAVTTRGLKEEDMDVIAECIALVLKSEENIEKVKGMVAELTAKYPLNM